MALFLDIETRALTKDGEELCGDVVRIHRSEDRVIVVLSDGLGSGVKANILATLTAEIVTRLLDADLPLQEVLGTVVGTLPVCRVRGIAYSTFTVLDIDRRTDAFRILNFDNPAPYWIRKGRLLELSGNVERMVGREITVARGTLNPGDLLCLITDGILYDGVPSHPKRPWNQEAAGEFLEKLLLTNAATARIVTGQLLRKARLLHGPRVADDATVVSLHARRRSELIVFTGPPSDASRDIECARRVMDFPGKRAVCGGTTGDIVATFLGEIIDVDLSSQGDDLPPAGTLAGVDLLTEGLLTLSRALALLREANGEARRVPSDGNPAAQLALAMINADYILFLVGQARNASHSGLQLQRELPSRNRVVAELAEFLRARGREIVVENI